MTATEAPTDRSYAEELDAGDPLGAFRERFVIDDPGLIYLDGNSLGRLPRSTQARLRQLIDSEWGRELIDGWDRWLDLPMTVGDLIGTELLDARQGEVVVADSTTVNFYRVAAAALDARTGRRAILTDRPNFPTDRYVLQGVAAARDLAVRWLEPEPVEGTQPSDVEAALDEDVAQRHAVSHVRE